MDPKEVYSKDFPGETFRVLKEKEVKQFGDAPQSDEESSAGGFPCYGSIAAINFWSAHTIRSLNRQLRHLDGKFCVIDRTLGVIFRITFGWNEINIPIKSKLALFAKPSRNRCQLFRL